MNLARWDGVFPLYIAAQFGHVDILCTLAEAGANVEARCHGVTPLLKASQQGHLDIVRVLCSRFSASVNQAGPQGVTSLFIAAQQGHLDVVRALMAAGADASLRTDDGDTPMAIAQQCGHQHVVHALTIVTPQVASFASLLGMNPVELAKQLDVDLLIHHCGGSSEAAQEMYFNDDQAQCRKVAPPKILVGPSEPALLTAARKGQLVEVLALVESGADVDEAEKEAGVTPLCSASQLGHLSVVRALVEAGASVGLARSDGCCPLSMSARRGHLSVVRALLASGASVHQEENDGMTSLDTASLRGHVEVSCDGEYIVPWLSCKRILFFTHSVIRKSAKKLTYP